MIYVILGMHKSGTTLVAQILHSSGINMGSDIDAQTYYDQGNKYERASTREINLDLLGCDGLSSIDIASPRSFRLSKAQQQQMRDIIRRCSKRYTDWGFKDPRTCLVYPLWASELPEHKLIVVHRSLDELWLRYRPKRPYRRYQDLHMAWKLVQRWCEHNANIVQYLRQTDMDYLVLDYGRLMSTQTEFDRLQQFVGRKLVDRRRPDLYRNRLSQQSIPLAIAKWLLEKQSTYRPEIIAAQLEAMQLTTG